VGLARAALAQEDDVAPLADVFSGGQLMEQASVEPGGRLLIKVLQRLQERKLSLPQPPFEPVFSAQLQFDLS